MLSHTHTHTHAVHYVTETGMPGCSYDVIVTRLLFLCYDNWLMMVEAVDIYCSHPGRALGPFVSLSVPRVPCSAGGWLSTHVLPLFVNSRCSAVCLFIRLLLWDLQWTPIYTATLETWDPSVADRLKTGDPSTADSLHTKVPYITDSLHTEDPCITDGHDTEDPCITDGHDTDNPCITDRRDTEDPCITDSLHTKDPCVIESCDSKDPYITDIQDTEDPCITDSPEMRPVCQVCPYYRGSPTGHCKYHCGVESVFKCLG